MSDSALLFSFKTSTSFDSICKIGEDVILVEVVESCPRKKNKQPVRVFDAGTGEEEYPPSLKPATDSFKNADN